MTAGALCRFHGVDSVWAKDVKQAVSIAARTGRNTVKRRVFMAKCSKYKCKDTK